MDTVVTDHRSRVAAERRERTRDRLLESALWVLARRGSGASVIQEVIAHAKVAQGTFYNHFRTSEELQVAVSQQLNNELLMLIEAAVGDFTDPAKRIASGTRLYLHTAREFPLFGSFVAAVGLQTAAPSSLVHALLPPHIETGQQTGRFAAMPVAAALDLIAGTCLAAVTRIVAGGTPEAYPEQVIMAILRGLGVPGKQAQRLVQIELPRIAPAPLSLLGRAQQRG